MHFALTPLLPFAADDEHGGGITFHAPSIAEFFPDAVFFAGTSFEMNRIVLIRFLCVLTIVLVFWLGTRRMKLVPGRFQGLIEMGLDLVRVKIGRAHV